ncbi:MAG: hypothetical protein QXH91_09740 [Candidatus Bathyarchaeia archaeon]
MKSSKKEPNPTVKSKSTKDKPAFAIGDSFGIGAYTYRGGVIPIVDFRVLRLYQLGILVGIGYSQRTEEIVFPFVGVAYLFKSKYLSNSSVVIGLANERFSVGFRLSF